MSVASRLFNSVKGGRGEAKAIAEITQQLRDANAPYERLGWDDYDNSLELHGVPDGYRLPAILQETLKADGFSIVYVNHKDKWETHYNFSGSGAVVGWRVSYPSKRGKNEQGIWVEKPMPSWPRDWFDSGYVIIKEPT